MDFNSIISSLDGYVWGWTLVSLVLGVGILLTFRTRFVQFTHLGLSLKLLVSNDDSGKGEVSSFQALCTALSATIGTGNIVGVATAITAGGPGALFWLVAASVLGMATKYAEGLLAIKYRTVDSDGHTLGGPFYYIERGLGETAKWGGNWKWLGKTFAIFGMLAGIMGTGTITQINGITSAIDRVVSSRVLFNVGKGGEAHGVTLAVVIGGIAVTAAAAFVIIGGVKRIARFSELVVPFMAGAYVLFAVLIVVFNMPLIPTAVALVFKTAFDTTPVAGALAGITVKLAIQKGIARGIFSNEAGLGSAPIAAATAQTDSPVKQGLVTMTGTLFTVVICIMTGLAIIVTGAWNPNVTSAALEGFDVTAFAFEKGLPFANEVCVVILSVSLAMFAFTTIIGWDYYSERCLEYLVGTRHKYTLMSFRVLYIAAIAIGPYLTVSSVWHIASIFNGLMAFPNLIALLLLSGVVGRETKEFFRKEKEKKKAAKLARKAAK